MLMLNIVSNNCRNSMKSSRRDKLQFVCGVLRKCETSSSLFTVLRVINEKILASSNKMASADDKTEDECRRTTSKAERTTTTERSDTDVGLQQQRDHRINTLPNLKLMSKTKSVMSENSLTTGLDTTSICLKFSFY